MTTEQLKKLKAELPTGARRDLAIRLGCDPSKITKALDGFVKSSDFMARLQAEANRILSGKETVSL